MEEFQKQFVDVFNAANPDVELEIVLQEDLPAALDADARARTEAAVQVDARAAAGH